MKETSKKRKMSRPTTPREEMSPAPDAPAVAAESATMQRLRTALATPEHGGAAAAAGGGAVAAQSRIRLPVGPPPPLSASENLAKRYLALLRAEVNNRAASNVIVLQRESVASNLAVPPGLMMRRESITRGVGAAERFMRLSGKLRQLLILRRLTVDTPDGRLDLLEEWRAKGLQDGIADGALKPFGIIFLQDPRTLKNELEMCDPQQSDANDVLNRVFAVIAHGDLRHDQLN